MIEQGIINLLLGKSVIPSGPLQAKQQAALASIKTAVGANVFPDNAPQGAAYPYLIIARRSGDHGRSINGGPVGMGKPTLAVEAYNPSSNDAKQLADWVRQLLDGFRGNVALANGLAYIQGCFLQEDADDRLAPIHADERGTEACSRTFKVFWNEP